MNQESNNANNNLDTNLNQNTENVVFQGTSVPAGNNNQVNYNELNQSVNSTEQLNNNISNQQSIENINIPNYNNSNVVQKNNSKIVIGILIGIIVVLILVIIIILNIKQKDNISKNDKVINTTQKENNIIDTKEDEEDKQDDENKTEEKEIVSNNISEDWKKGEFQLDGNSFKLNTDYSNLVSKGWSVDFKKYGYSNGYILNHKDKILSTLNLENNKFSNSGVSIGLVNLDTTSKDVAECQFWAISVNNAFTKTPVDFVLPGGITNGSTIKEIEKVYGVPESKNIYRAESSGYTVYTYEYDYKVYLKLTIYDTDGLKGFDYKIY